jgi:hypothetical protein
MAKNPKGRVIELEARLAELRLEREAVAGGLSQINMQLGAAIAAGGDDLQLISELRRELTIDQQRLPELTNAIPVVEQQLEVARAEALKVEQQRHRRAAWIAANKRAEVAGAIDDKLAEVGKLWDELVSLTEAENSALRAAGGGAGTSTTMMNRLQWLIPSVLWHHCSAMLAAARFERVPSARWQTLSSFMTTPSRSDAA